MFTEEDVIYSYSRRQAIEDGVLVDASELAREAGFRFPVALTHSVWCECVKVPEGVAGQDETGRLWDILQMLRWAIKKSPGGECELFFELLVRNDDRKARTVRLKSLCGPGDDGEPVITIMQPDED